MPKIIKSKTVRSKSIERIDSRFEKILVSEEEINQACDRAVEWINKTYKDKYFLMVGVLKGCIPFIGKIFNRIKSDVILDFMTVSTFRGGKASDRKTPKIVMDLANDVSGRDVLIVEDIIDSGRSLDLLVKILKLRQAKSVKICCLFDRISGRKVELKADFSGIILPKGFTFGFGLDYCDYLRNIPYVGTLKQSVIDAGINSFEKNGREK